VATPGREQGAIGILGEGEPSVNIDVAAVEEKLGRNVDFSRARGSQLSNQSL
jgi:hypothetical protein